LLSAGLSQILVLLATASISLMALTLVYLIRPTVIGEYGTIAVRHLTAAVSSRLNPNQAAS
jgi:hypothetical protein